jgi:hypothetical protein
MAWSALFKRVARTKGRAMTTWLYDVLQLFVERFSKRISRIFQLCPHFTENMNGAELSAPINMMMRHWKQFVDKMRKIFNGISQFHAHHTNWQHWWVRQAKFSAEFGSLRHWIFIPHHLSSLSSFPRVLRRRLGLPLMAWHVYRSSLRENWLLMNFCLEGLTNFHFRLYRVECWWCSDLWWWCYVNSKIYIIAEHKKRIRHNSIFNYYKNN